LNFLDKESDKSKKNPGEKADPSEKGLLEREFPTYSSLANIG